MEDKENVQIIERIKIARTFISFESCMLNISKIEDVYKRFMESVLNGEVTVIEYGKIQENVVNDAITVLRNTKDFLKRSNKKISTDEKDKLEEKLVMLKGLLSKINLPYEVLKEQMSNLIRSLDYLKTSANDTIILWKEIDYKFNRINDEIIPKLNNPRRKDNLIEFVSRAVIYFIDSMNIDSKNDIFLFDRIDAAIDGLSSYGLEDKELEQYSKTIRDLIFKANEKIALLQELYPDFFSENPYVLYSQEQFAKETAKFKSLMNKKIFEVLGLNYSLGAILAVLTSLYHQYAINHETSLGIGSFSLMAVVVWLFCDRVDEVLSQEEQLNDSIKVAQDTYDTKRDNYLKKHILKKVN